MNAGDDVRPELPRTSDPFELLGIPEDADAKTIKRAYVRWIRIYRPEDAPEEFKRIRAAFEAATQSATLGIPARPIASAAAPPDTASTRPTVERRLHGHTPYGRSRSDIPPAPPEGPYNHAQGEPAHPSFTPEASDLQGEPAHASFAPEASDGQGEPVHASFAPEASELVAARLVRSLVEQDDFDAISALLRGDTVRGISLGAHHDEIATLLAILYDAWFDSARARACFDRRITLGSPEDEPLRAWCTHVLECTAVMERVPALAQAPESLRRALRTAPPFAPCITPPRLHELYEDASRRYTQYAEVLDVAADACPDLLVLLDQLVGDTSNLEVRALDPDAHQRTLEAIEAVDAALGRDPFLTLVFGASALALAATVAAYGFMGWWILMIPAVGSVLVFAALFYYFNGYTDRLYRRRLRPWMLHVAISTGTANREIVHTLKGVHGWDKDDAHGAHEEVILEDYALGWLAALHRLQTSGYL